MIGSEIIHFKRVDSTSNYIATLLKESKVVNGLVILADEQTEGRGQRGAKWQSTPGQNILCSCYIQHNELSINHQQNITHFVSLAIINCLNHVGLKAKIKWPNDIVIENKKIAGILIENQFQGQKIKSSIIGIGLNVLQEDFDFINSTSIVKELKKEILLKTVFNQLIYSLNQEFIHLQQHSFSVLEINYRNNLWLLNESSEYETENGEKFNGIIKGTDSMGKLIIYREDKTRIESFGLKEIKFTKRNAL
jgi:BirA family biotin operon repressor/biotin-[acetyl-CoA-carboxylase] ligase